MYVFACVLCVSLVSCGVVVCVCLCVYICVCMCNARRKRRFDYVQIVDEEASNASKKSASCVMCRIQEGDIDAWRDAGASGSENKLVKVTDGMGDYCYCLIVLQYNTISVKDVRVFLRCAL